MARMCGLRGSIALFFVSFHCYFYFYSAIHFFEHDISPTASTQRIISLIFCGKLKEKLQIHNLERCIFILRFEFCCQLFWKQKWKPTTLSINKWRDKNENALGSASHLKFTSNLETFAVVLTYYDGYAAKCLTLSLNLHGKKSNRIIMHLKWWDLWSSCHILVSLFNFIFHVKSFNLRCIQIACTVLLLLLLLLFSVGRN